MTAEDLFKLTHDVLDAVGYPRWPAADDSNEQDELTFLPEENGDPAQWALAPSEEDGQADVEQCLAVGVDMAAALIRDHLRTVLIRGAWQVQVSIRKELPRWRLVDCLSPADGGGDRLNDSAEYPWGDDELHVLCDSVRAVRAEV